MVGKKKFITMIRKGKKNQGSKIECKINIYKHINGFVIMNLNP